MCAYATISQETSATEYCGQSRTGAVYVPDNCEAAHSIRFKTAM